MISIIIPVYNREKYIAQCLDSILSQGYTDFEILVVNDGSADRSGEIIREYAAKDSRIRYFEQKNQGVSVARNQAIELVQGKYFTFVDSDDILWDGALAYYVEKMEKTGTDIFIEEEMSKFETFTDSQGKPGSHTGLLKNSVACRYFIDRNVGGYAGGKIYRTEKLRNIRFPENISMMEDFYMFVKLFQEDHTFCFSKSGYYGYRQHSGQVYRNLDIQKRFQVLFVYYDFFCMMRDMGFSQKDMRIFSDRKLKYYVNWNGYSVLAQAERQEFKRHIALLTELLKQNPLDLFMKLRVYLLNGKCEKLVNSKLPLTIVKH